MIRKFGLVVALAAAISTPALAQQQTQADDKVVIEGRQLEDAVRDFVAEVAAAPKGSNLARWDRKVCVGELNLRPEYAQKLIDHVSLVAVAVGLEPGEPGCRPNILILADSNGDDLATRLVAKNPRAFQPDYASTNLGSKALSRFETSHAPVRWWHISETVLADSGKPAMQGQSVLVRRASRLRGNVREDLAHALIILDTSRIGSISFGSLCDYVAMVALAQVDAQADMGKFRSILNLFSEKADNRTIRMTQWDLDYLEALYKTPGDDISTRDNARHIARDMLDRQLKADGGGR
ncbi:MAG TPA: hypothetical protein VG942_10935 [Hyphomonadaceae bacterium]|nr:hypothetical protein [Hyphomonadaceae bacterium]